ncbi:hypothetical protein IQ255_23445 [Pleurocapsales cyanobacterium LEGE 10410]|nr:hypothetical protein [Pleurocapsales cyanobacterium LEGE 10410]
MVQPTSYEQYMLEMINRARLNPQAEADLLGIGLNDGLAANTISGDSKQPLAFNLLLNDSARSHSQWMLDTDTFSHTGAGGSSAGDRMSNAGYQFTGSWSWGENLGYRGTTGTLNLGNAVTQVHQGLFESPGHRTNILSNNFREIGIATLNGDYQGYDSLMATQNYAKSGSEVFLTGVAYDDLVLEDDFYSIGEGLGGIEVTAIDLSNNGLYTTTTMASGGYQIALPSGSYDVSFANNGQTLGNSSQITIGSQNVKLDLNTDNILSNTATNPAQNIAQVATSSSNVMDSQNAELDSNTDNTLDNTATNPAQHIGELGTSRLNHLNQTIQFDNSYNNPVVFAMPLSYNGGDPAIARITDIQSDSFSVYVQEAEYKDGKHVSENFSYLVLEAGTWELADGTILEVGTLNTNGVTTSRWESIDFESDFQDTPAILSQVQTDNDSQFVRTRQQASSVDGFKLSMEEEEALKYSGHGTETVGWLAMESSSGTWDGLDYQAGQVGTKVDHTFDTIDFAQTFDQAPNLLAGLSSYNGSDSAGLRYRSLGSSQVQLKVEEDRSFDREIAHVGEMVDFLAIAGSGDLSATASII